MLENERLAKVAQTSTSRRRFLSGSARLAGGSAIALAAAGSPLSVFANHRTRERARGGDYTTGDLDVLNYALTLEHLEANFYIQAVNKFSESQVEDYIASLGFGPPVFTEAYQRVVDVRDHEVIHVETLISVIQSLGGTPVPPCNYDFSAALATVASFFDVAQVLEDTGVMAYDGAIDQIESRQLQTAAATIATVEARHASYFRLLNQLNPFPEPFDDAVEPPQIIEMVLATGLIVSCPVNPPVPDNPVSCRA